MLKKTLAIVGLSTVLACSLNSSAVAAPQDFVGTWKNTNSRTDGITRFIVRSRGRNRLNIQVFGQCYPNDCDWGSRRLITYGNNPSDRNHLAATANYNQSFANQVLTLRLVGSRRNRIRLQSFTRFTDRSNRENYVSQETFRRTTNGSRKPDLVVQISGPSRARAGDNIGSSVRVEAKNTGRATAPGTRGRVNPDNGYMIDLVLSTDRRVPSGFANYSPNFSEDVLLRGGRISRTVDLAPGATRIYSSEIARSGRIPRDTPTGRYWICARIDPGEKVAESNERNNLDCTQIRIR
ncbi:MAG: CARDB domain-containing protein [Nostocaceae cyanobacterium]|nr:CARDB domain-containing protein [Nostocaceae cyanobacterium]